MVSFKSWKIDESTNATGTGLNADVSSETNRLLSHTTPYFSNCIQNFELRVLSKSYSLIFAKFSAVSHFSSISESSRRELSERMKIGFYAPFEGSSFYLYKSQIK